MKGLQGPSCSGMLLFMANLYSLSVALSRLIGREIFERTRSHCGKYDLIARLDFFAKIIFFSSYTTYAKS